MIVLNILGKPQPGGSKKGFAVKGKHTGKWRAVVVDDNEKSADWKGDVKSQTRKQLPPGFRQFVKDTPVCVVVYFNVLRPKFHFKKNGELKPNTPKHPTKKPDGTKFWRSTEDALTGIIWEDDAQVVSQLVHKRFSDTQGADIYIEELE